MNVHEKIKVAVMNKKDYIVLGEQEYKNVLKNDELNFDHIARLEGHYDYWYEVYFRNLPKHEKRFDNELQNMLLVNVVFWSTIWVLFKLGVI